MHPKSSERAVDVIGLAIISNIHPNIVWSAISSKYPNPSMLKEKVVIKKVCKYFRGRSKKYFFSRSSSTDFPSMFFFPGSTWSPLLRFSISWESDLARAYLSSLMIFLRLSSCRIASDAVCKFLTSITFFLNSYVPSI